MDRHRHGEPNGEAEAGVTNLGNGQTIALPYTITGTTVGSVSSLTYQIDGGEPIPVSVAQDGSFSAPLTCADMPTNGTHSIKLNATDPIGTIITTGVIFDTVTPIQLVTLTNLTDGQNIEAPYTINGTVAANITALSYQMNGLTAIPVVINGNSSFAIALSSADVDGDGNTNWIGLTTTDTDGNTQTTWVSFSVGTSSQSSAPKVSLDNLTDGDVVELPSTVTGTAASGVTSLTCQIDGGTPAAVTLASDGSFAIPLTTGNVRGNGDHSLTFNASDANNNVVTSSTIFSVLGQPVSLGVENLGDGQIIAVPYAVTGSAASGIATVSYQIDGGTPIPVTLASDGAYSLALTAANVQGDGDHILTLIGTALNGDFTTTSVNFRASTINLANLSEGQVVSLPYTVTGIASSSVASLTYQLDGDAPVSVTLGSDGSFVIPLTTSHLSSGSHNLTFNVNNGVSTNSLMFGVSGQIVAVSLDNLNDGQTIALPYTVTGVAASGVASLTYQIDGGDPAAVTLASDGMFSIVLTDSDAPGNGHHTLTFNEVAADGSVRNESTTFNRGITAIALNNLSDGQIIAMPYTVTGTASGAVVSVAFQIDNGAPVSISVGSDGSFSVPLTAGLVAADSTWLTVQAWDADGNVTSICVSFSAPSVPHPGTAMIYVDNLFDDDSIDEDANGTVPMVVLPYTVTGTTTGVSMSYQINNGSVVQLSVGSDGSFEIPLTTSDVASDGTIGLTLTATDSDGNLTSESIVILQGIPLPKPVAALTAPPNENFEGTEIILTGTATDSMSSIQAAGFTFSWLVTKTRDGITTDFASNTTSPGQQSTAVTFTPDDDGTYVVTITAADQYGYPSAMISRTISVANVAPNVALDAPPATVVVGTELNLASTVADPGSVDQASTFTYAWKVTKIHDQDIDNQFASGTTSTVTFTPDQDESGYIVVFSVFDKDNAEGYVVRTIKIGSQPFAFAHGIKVLQDGHCTWDYADNYFLTKPNDGDVAKCYITRNGVTQTISTLGYGFRLPSNAVIDGVQVQILAGLDSAAQANVTVSSIYLMLGQQVLSANGAIPGQTLGAGLAWQTFGSPTEHLGCTLDVRDHQR